MRTIESRTLLVVALGILLCWLLPARSLALDGVIDGRSTVQEGQAGTEKYSQRWTQSEVNGNQRFRLGGGIQLRFDGRIHREWFHSRIGAVRSNFDRRTDQAGASVGHNGGWGSVTANALLFDQRALGAGTDDPHLKRRQLTTTADFGRDRIRVSAGGFFTSSRQEFRSIRPTREEEWSGSVGMRAGIPRVGDLGYRFSTLTDRNLTVDSRSTQASQTITFDKSSRFDDGRGTVALQTTAGFFTQTQSWQTGGVGVSVVLPHTAGVLLDDSPELHDPLEEDVMPVADLYDGNRQTATVVQIGDSAPPVREFGGDYRNIVFDFGEAVEPDSAVLYVDRTLLSPEMFRWQVYISNDPEGRRWEEMSGVGVAYREWGIGFQGWTLTFSQPVSARFLKMVDVKLGPTIADLAVTELEVLIKEDEVTNRSRSNTTNHRVGLSLNYRLSRGVRAGYDLTYRRRTLTGQSGVLENVGQGFSASLTRGIWILSGRHEVRALEGQKSRSTKANSQSVSLKRGQDRTLVAMLSWSRVHDESPGVEKTSNSVSLSSNWKAAPYLRLSQRVTGARLSDRVADRTATSLVVVTSVIGEPTYAMSLDLQASERWVSQEAGTGFSRFDDTSFTFGWRPVPRISLQSMVRYQLRNGGDWLTRNSVAWELLSGGGVTAGLSAQHFRDTRTRESQRGGGIQIEWNARPGLTIQGNVEAVVLKTAGQENSPVNTGIRGILRY